MERSTQRLYFQDPNILHFHARVVAVAAHKGKASIVLDRTAFYPEGGGQPGDTGMLRCEGNAWRVEDVQVDDSGRIHHLVAGVAGGLEGRGVSGVVDAVRRRDLTAQHTAQHMLSRALLEVADAETMSARLGLGSSTIDLKIAALSDEQLSEAEDMVNQVVLEDRPVRALFPSPQELRQLPLRRQPKVDHDVRVIEIEGYDLSPCGGTHCTRSSQVGLVHVTRAERYKAMVRVTFVAGRRAAEDYRAKDAVLRSLARDMTCGVEELAVAVGKLRHDAAARQQQLFVAHQRYAALQASCWHRSTPAARGGVAYAVHQEPQADPALLRALAAAFASRADVVAIVGSNDEAGDWQVVVERGAEAAFDAGGWLRALAAQCGGKGGGGRDHAEGRLPAAVKFSLQGLGLC